jgi:hypothetical protein
MIFIPSNICYNFEQPIRNDKFSEEGPQAAWHKERVKRNFRENG